MEGPFDGFLNKESLLLINITHVVRAGYAGEPKLNRMPWPTDRCYTMNQLLPWEASWIDIFYILKSSLGCVPRHISWYLNISITIDATGYFVGTI